VILQSAAAYVEHVQDPHPPTAGFRLSHARAVDELFIRWRATGTVNGRFREWSGVDHIQFHGSKVIRIDAIFDTAALS
jgi:hypothetical protein